MILHKLLFFKLPYRYAATGDAAGEPVSTTEEGAKMDKLEKEVLEYPGWVKLPDSLLRYYPRLIVLQLQIHIESGRRI